MKQKPLDGTCPYCGSTAMTTNEIDWDMTHAFRALTCDECGKDFNETYTLTASEKVEE